MALSTNHQCPACTGPLRFDAKTNLLVCDYCDSKYEVSKIDELYGKKVEDSVKAGVDTEKGRAEAEAAGSTVFRMYTCSSCGAQLFCDEVTVASSCPYCGNPNVIAGKFNGDKMPDLVIPFKMEKKEAVEALSKFYKNKKLLPKVFKDENHIEEVKGVYIPFWLYSGSVDVAVEALASRTNSVMTKKEKIITTSHYNVSRMGNVPFNKVPVDASLKMDNSMMDSLEPFMFTDLKKFSPSYLPGFLAEVYDDDAENCKKRLEQRVENSAVESMMSDIRGYETVSFKNKKVRVNLSGKPSYTLLPVWLLCTKWKDSNYLFAMNGQTGKMVGKLPIDWGKFFRRLFGILLIGTAVLTPLAYFVVTMVGV